MADKFVAQRKLNGAGGWTVYVERVVENRPNPDPWGDGPLIAETIAKNIRPKVSLPKHHGFAARPPAETDDAFLLACTIAKELNERNN